MSRLDDIRARHEATKVLRDSENSIGPECFQIHQDRAHLLDLLNGVEAWIEAAKQVKSITKHGWVKANHYQDAADELTLILDKAEGEG